MKTPRLIAAAFFSLTVQAVMADPVTVRSGDHNAFTRLAFDVPPGLEWSLDQEGREVTVVLSGHSDGFALGGIFDRIDRRHIASVEGSPGSLRIRLACDCVAEAFDVNSRMFAVDIAEGSPDPDVRQAYQQEASGTAAATQPGSVPLQLPRAGFSPDRGIPLVVAADPVTPPSADLLRTFQTQLTREIGAAATQGVLDPAARPSLPVVAMRPRQVAAEPAPLPQAEQAQTQPTGNIRISSSLDPEALPGGREAAQLIQDLSCLPSNQVDVTNWSDNRPAMVQIADLRTKLFDDRDAVNKDVALQLARVYVHFGFGPEAMRVLQLDPELQQANSAVIELGEIMEYGHVRTPRVLHQSLECSDEAALWAALSIEEIESTVSLDTNAALRALNALPLHLRSFLAPELSKRLLAYGDKKGAAAALRSIERVAQEQPPAALMAKASLDMAQGEVSRAKANLERVVNSNSAQSAEALIAFVDARLAAGDPIERDVALLVEAYLQELKDSPLAPALRRAQVLSLAQSGQFDAAMEKISAASPELRDTVLEKLATNADDIVFLEYALGAADSFDPPPAATTRQAMAERLMGLGFADAAEALLSPSAPEFSDPSARRLKARIALAQGKPALAQAHLLGSNSEEDLKLIAAAQKMAGDVSGASETFSRLQDTKAAGRAALLSDNWLARINSETPTYGPLSEVATTSVDPSPELSGMLARTRTALTESANARQLLRTLISAEAGAEN